MNIFLILSKNTDFLVVFQTPILNTFRTHLNDFEHLNPLNHSKTILKILKKTLISPFKPNKKPLHAYAQRGIPKTDLKHISLDCGLWISDCGMLRYLSQPKSDYGFRRYVSQHSAIRNPQSEIVIIR
jgi:hypothetical protein